jgi:tetratricopeptide (TPR) repeat protein
MFTNKVRLFIGFIFLLSLIMLTARGFYEFAAVALLMILLLIWDYFKQGTLIIAAKHYHHKEYDLTERYLLQIKWPQWLSKKRRGYYEFIMGAVCLQKHDFEDAERHYEIAAQYPLRSVNDHVAALVHVANISIRQGNYEKAEAYLQLTEQHNTEVNAKMKDVIDRLRGELKNK